MDDKKIDRNYKVIEGTKRLVTLMVGSPVKLQYITNIQSDTHIALLGFSIPLQQFM